MAKPTVAILGRPNVGKSTLFNRMVGKLHAIVSPVEGVTRDRIYGSFEWAGKDFNIIDTGGYLPDTEDIMNKHVRLQAELATEEADLLILLVDGKSEITSSDRILAELIVKSQKPYILVSNKIDDNAHEDYALGFYELGLGEPYTIAALSGRKIGDLCDIIVSKLPDQNITVTEDENIINLAIVGMPNVGKSSLMNAVLKEEKSIVTDIAGTTRDSVDSYIKYFNRQYKIIDTAGLRRKAKIGDNIEYYSSVRTFRVIDDCDVAAVLIDGSKGFGNQDRDIVRYVIDQGKGLVLVVNKWDLVEKDTSTMKNYIDDIEYHFPSVSHYPIQFISVKNNRRIWNVLELASAIYDERRKKIKTSELNEFVETAMYRYPPPAVQGKHLKVKYVTQVHHSPPIFVFFSNHPKLFPVAYKRYLENRMRETFGYKGVPIRISFREK